MGTLNKWSWTTKTTKPNNGKCMTLFERRFFSGFAMRWLNIWAIFGGIQNATMTTILSSSAENQCWIYALNKYGFPKARNTKSHMCTAFRNIHNDKIFSNGVVKCEYQNKHSSIALLNISWLASVLVHFHTLQRFWNLQPKGIKCLRSHSRKPRL